MGSGPQTSTTTQDTDSHSVQQYAADPKIKKGAYQALNTAMALAQKGYHVPRQMFTPWDPYARAAANRTSLAYNDAAPYFTQARNYTERGAEQVTPGDIDDFFNPYRDFALQALNTDIGVQNRDLTGQLTQATGGVGADRIAVGMAEKNRTDQIARGVLMGQFWKDALAAAQQQKEKLMQAARDFAQFGIGKQQTALQGAQALGAIGAQKMGLQQNRLNAAFTQALANLEAPWKSNQYLASIVGGLAPALGGTTTTDAQTSMVGSQTMPGTSPLGTIGGLGLSAMGMMGGMGKGSGGRVTGQMVRRAQGGAVPAGPMGDFSIGTPPGIAPTPEQLFKMFMASAQPQGYEGGGEVPGYDIGGAVGKGSALPALGGMPFPSIGIPDWAGVGMPGITPAPDALPLFAATSPIAPDLPGQVGTEGMIPPTGMTSPFAPAGPAPTMPGVPPASLLAAPVTPPPPPVAGPPPHPGPTPQQMAQASPWAPRPSIFDRPDSIPGSPDRIHGAPPLPGAATPLLASIPLPPITIGKPEAAPTVPAAGAAETIPLPRPNPFAAPAESPFPNPLAAPDPAVANIMAPTQPPMGMPKIPEPPQLPAMENMANTMVADASPFAAPPTSAPPPVAPPPSAPTMETKGSWYGNYSGKNQWTDRMDNNRPALPGATNNVPGIAMPDRSTLGKWFDVTAPNGQTMRVQHTDIGPHPKTGRGIDINAAAAEHFGYTPKNFPTDGRFTAVPAARSDSLIGAQAAPAPPPPKPPGPQSSNPYQGAVVHYTGGNSVEGAIATLQKRGLTGYNAFIDKDGSIIPNPLVKGTAGQHMKPGWGPMGEGRSNANMEGIGIVANGERDVTPAQKQTALALLKQRGYGPDAVFGHGEVNPGHKHADEGMSVVSMYRQGEPGSLMTAQAAERPRVEVPGRGPSYNPVTGERLIAVPPEVAQATYDRAFGKGPSPIPPAGSGQNPFMPRQPKAGNLSQRLLEMGLTTLAHADERDARGFPKGPWHAIGKGGLAALAGRRADTKEDQETIRQEQSAKREWEDAQMGRARLEEAQRGHDITAAGKIISDFRRSTIAQPKLKSEQNYTDPEQGEGVRQTFTDGSTRFVPGGKITGKTSASQTYKDRFVADMIAAGKSPEEARRLAADPNIDLKLRQRAEARAQEKAKIEFQANPTEDLYELVQKWRRLDGLID